MWGSRNSRDAICRSIRICARFGIDECRNLDFCTPYGCSKGAADQYVLDYARSFGLKAAVLRMSCIYGPHQFGTEDQGWVAHFLIRALRGESITIYGDGKQVRDILHVKDAVAAYRAVLGAIGRVSGRAFNLGGGPANAVSLRAVLDEIAMLDRPRGRVQLPGLAHRRPALLRRRHAPPDRGGAMAGARSAGARDCATSPRWVSAELLRGECGRHEREAARARMRVALVNPRWSFERQHLFRLPRAASAARAGLREGEARARRSRRADAGRPSVRSCDEHAVAPRSPASVPT